MILLRFRQLEKVERQIASFRNHHCYTLHCRHHGVFPPSLTLKSALKGPKVEAILHRAQNALMNERITGIKHRLEQLRQQRSELDHYLFTVLPMDTYTEVNNWMAHARESVFTKVRDRHQRKFQTLMDKQKPPHKDTLIVKVSDEEKEQITSKWVINISDRTFSDAESSLLKRGLNFTVTPSSPPVNDYIIAIEMACKLAGAGSKQADRIRSDCVKLLKNAPPPKPNISADEQKALQALGKDDAIMILPADKGRAVVVMNTVDYKTKAKSLLADSDTYKVLKKDPTAKFTDRLVKLLQKVKQEGGISELLYKTLYPTSTLIPRFYGLPKIHKKDVPLRPIVASRGSLTYKVAKHIARILAPIVGRNGYALKNSADLVSQMKDCTL